MTPGTLFASLVFAALLTLLLAVLFALMQRGWRRRARHQAELIGPLPAAPDTVGPAMLITHGRYLGCVLAPSRCERIVVGDLAYPSRAVLIRYQEGIMVQRNGAGPMWIPRESIRAIHTKRGPTGKGVDRVVTRNGILAIRWQLPSGVELDTNFRGRDSREYTGWLEEVA